jgi:hypothetical protein
MRSAIYKKCIDDNISEADATQHALRSMAFFGDSDIPHPSLTGDDRPLWQELKPRVIEWSIRQGVQGGEGLDASGYTSVNALIRAEIRNGNL